MTSFNSVSMDALHLCKHEDNCPQFPGILTGAPTDSTDDISGEKKLNIPNAIGITWRFIGWVSRRHFRCRQRCYDNLNRRKSILVYE